MSVSQNALSTNEDNISTKRDGQPEDAKIAFASRLREKIDKTGLKDAEIARRSGVSTSALSSYLKGRSFPNSEQLFPLCDVLGVDPRWLISGVSPSRPSIAIADADAADWEQLPFYDLRNITDTGLGEAQASTSVRRDWLNRTFGVSKGLWLTRLLSDYRALDLMEGDQVICCNTSFAEVQERHLCIWRTIPQGHIVIGRYTVMQKTASQPAGNDEEYWINPYSPIGIVDSEEPDIVPVGRILGRFLQRF